MRDDDARGLGTVHIRPVRSDARRMIIPVARKKYFQNGGFTVSGERVRLQARSGRVTDTARSDIASVTLTHSSRGDTRVLLTRTDGSVLAQDASYWYNDGALRRLASAIGCHFVEDPYRGFAQLERIHPGTLRYRWERHPYLVGLGLGVIICGPILLIGLLTH